MLRHGAVSQRSCSPRTGAKEPAFSAGKRGFVQIRIQVFLELVVTRHLVPLTTGNPVKYAVGLGACPGVGFTHADLGSRRA